MTEIVVLLAVGAGAFLLWHHFRPTQTAPVYLGAPAWPAMAPVPVPTVSLPNGLQQSATYYGVSLTLLEPFFK